MLDCGFGIRETERRLALLKCAPEDIGALVVTHEHADHIGSAYRFAQRYGTPLYMSYGTYGATYHKLGTRKKADIRFCQSGRPFDVGGLTISPYTVPHDAREPLQFVFQSGVTRIGVLTDIGMPTPYVIASLQGLHALVLECNHDPVLLASSSYPASLKARISGDFGHLANHIAAQILVQVAHPGLKTVVAAHLSHQNNTHEAVLALLEQTCPAAAFHIASQHQELDWLEVSA